jgi:hypothetical protein
MCWQDRSAYVRFCSGSVFETGYQRGASIVGAIALGINILVMTNEIHLDECY